jgi:hypothetical protein
MSGPVGPRGLSILIFVALVALALAAIGWTQRHDGMAGTAGLTWVSGVLAR